MDKLEKYINGLNKDIEIPESVNKAFETQLDNLDKREKKHGAKGRKNKK